MQTCTDTVSLPHTMADLRNFDMTAVSVIDILPPRAGAQAGAKVAPLTYKGQDLKLIIGTPTQPVRIPFPASSFDGNPAATRVNLVLEIEDAIVQACFAALDKAIIEILTTRSVEFFKEQLSQEQVCMCFKPTLTNSPAPYKPVLKMKMEAGDKRRVNIWDEEGALVDLPSCLRNSKVVAQISMRPLWVASNSVGVSLQADNLMLVSQEAELLCPFRLLLKNVSERETMLDQAMLEDR